MKGIIATAVLSCLAAILWIAMPSQEVSANGYGSACGVYFSPSYIPYYAPVAAIKTFAYPVAYPVTYELGQPQQVAAKQAYTMRNDPEYERFLQFKAFEAGFSASQQAHAQQAQAAQQQAQQGYPQQGPQRGMLPPQRNVPLMLEHCGNCHGRELEQPKGGLILDPSIGLTGDQIAEVMKRMRLPSDHPDVMPPAPAKLQPEQKGAILEETLQLHQKGPPNVQNPQAGL